MKRIALILLLVLSSSGFSDEVSKAIQDNNLAKVKTIFDANPELVNKETEYDGYPIIIAAGGGNVEIVKYLLEKGAKVDVRSGETKENVILRLADKLGNLDDNRLKKYSEIIDLLAEKKAAFNVVDKFGRGPLLLLASRSNGPPASAKNQVEIVKVFKKYGAKFNEPGNVGCLVALLGSSLAGREFSTYGAFELAKGFIEIGADVNESEKATGNTPLMALLANSSIEDGDRVEILTFLLEKGASKNSKNKNKQKPADLIKKGSPLEDVFKKTKPKK